MSNIETRDVGAIGGELLLGYGLFGVRHGLFRFEG